MKKILLLGMVLVMSLAIFTGCGSKEDDGKLVVGYVCANLNDTGLTILTEGLKAAAEDGDVDLKVEDAQNDVAKQQDQVQNLITNGAKILIINPVDTSAMKPITKLAQDAEIPLIYVNRNPFGDQDPPEGVYYVGSKEMEAGQMQAEHLMKLVGDKPTNVAILQGELTTESTQKRTEGNTSVLDKNPNIKVLAKESGNYKRDQGMTLAENWITAYGKDLNVILSNNDEMALGALKALKEANRTDVIVMGVDAIEDALKSIKAGEMNASALQDLEGQGKLAMEVAVNLSKDKKVAKASWIKFELVTKDNVDDYLK